MSQAKKNGFSVLLAGGKSFRFGSDKAQAQLNGKSFVEILVETLNRSGFEVVLSLADFKSFPGLEELRWIKDPYPGEGPLQALYGSLFELGVPKVLLAACDMPLLLPEVVQRLWQESEQADITVLEFENKLFPLPAVYSKNVLPVVRDLLDRGKRDLKSLLAADLVLHKIKWQDWRLWDREARSLFNINSSEELREVSRLC